MGKMTKLLFYIISKNNLNITLLKNTDALLWCSHRVIGKPKTNSLKISTLVVLGAIAITDKSTQYAYSITKGKIILSGT